jgi:hypothetical protein
MGHAIISEMMKKIWAETAGIKNQEQRKQVYARKLFQSVVRTKSGLSV